MFSLAPTPSVDYIRHKEAAVHTLHGAFHHTTQPLPTTPYRTASPDAIPLGRPPFFSLEEILYGLNRRGFIPMKPNFTINAVRSGSAGDRSPCA
ncbi:hypothetical protein M413DRAFT_271071 [Hebeloma cylindrosporum]|uniref:Uncharacterized protein n=1 Tax=Hebeloma cylindrosporum TaxID=76867 RepID=A0A0C2YBJ5_HEBCY|nr:hypothetical protein M413DRAFT_271071 [Hebeloma cylindrosporum h7]